MTVKELTSVRKNYLSKYWEYERTYWDEFDYDVLNNCIWKKSYKFKNQTYNDITIMIDTETSKIRKDVYETRVHHHKNGFTSYEKIYKPADNHVVIWTLSIRLFDLNICTLYGRKPSELTSCIAKIIEAMKGQITYMYIFNLPYDYVFLRKFLNRDFGEPIHQLNVKPHYPVSLQYANGLILKDALILAQRKLAKWAEDMNVEHQKALGDWDYKVLRHQDTPITENELHYAEYDTLAGVECIDTLKNQLSKDIGTIPLTSTGILRELIKKEGAKNNAKKWFNKVCPDFKQYLKLLDIYHGGYTHGNRHHLNELIDENFTSLDFDGIIRGGDFASSYPFVLFKKYPASKFIPIEPKSIKFILDHAEQYAFMFKLCAVEIELKDDSIAMPYLQYSKTKYSINEVLDNGRVIAADYVEIYLNEIDLEIIEKQYKMKYSICIDVEASVKDYLPRWFTDIVFQLFKDKTSLKHVDEILYNIAKYKLNACYGLCCQRWDKPEIIEQVDGKYIEDTSKSQEDLFNETISKRSTILPYFVGVWCTSYAASNLFKMGEMCELWLYSDTDSCYGINWDMQKVEAYNQECINFMQERGYGGGVEHEGKTYYLGVIEFEADSEYTSFKYMGAKRYAGVCKKDGKIHITVAGVPKEKGATCLSSMDDFKPEFVFEGTKTGKLTHSHLYIEDIYINDYGDEVADSIDLSPCDYELDCVKYHSLDDYIRGVTEIYIDSPDDTDNLAELFGG